MSIKTSSAKAKGRNLQKWTRDIILELCPSLEFDDVKSTSMGAGGEDVQMSPAARKLMPFSIECKARKSIAVLKADRKKPLVVVDAEYFFRAVKKAKP